MTHASTVPASAVGGPGDRDHARPARGGRLPVPALAALGLFVAARVCGGLVLSVVSRSPVRGPLLLLGHSWDSVWYVRIAERGYGLDQHSAGAIHNDLAFFPLYPALIRALTLLTPLHGITSALLVSWTAAAVAAVGIHTLGARLYGPAVGAVLVALWGLLPHSVVLSMAYTEPLMTAFAAWSLYAAVTRRWLWAGALATLAGLSRPNGFAVAAAVLAAAAQEVWRARGRGVSPRLWTGAALAPVGWCGYVLWVGHRRGDPLGGYFTIQRLWGSRFDFGRGSLQFAKHMARHDTRLVYVIAMLIVAAGTLLFGLLLADRAPLPLAVYSGLLLVVALGGSGFFESKPRFLLPAYPLLIPVARALVRTARARPWHATVVASALAGLSFVYGAYLLVLARSPL
ncbi:mannosyltransferase family protein [Streptomyces sp. NPDC047022]|uniref:mannosyltransferase family protein n=1 Tax=Streptomyces sp. NPDC047022 TaxID=3155737 RepID=UPI0033E0351B